MTNRREFMGSMLASVAVAAIYAPKMARAAIPAPRDLAGQTPKLALYEGARLIGADPQNVGDDSVIEGGAFLVQNGMITQVGKKGAIQLPAGATRIDLTGKSVTPALIDLHCHMGFVDNTTGTDNGKNYTRANLVDQLQRAAYVGFGCIQSLGADMRSNLCYQVRDEGAIPNAALMRTAGDGFAWPGSGGGGGGGAGTGEGEKDRTKQVYDVTNVADARKWVRDLVPHNPNFVKIWVDDRGQKVKKLTPELYGAVIDEAHKHGLRCIAHVFDLEDAKGLIRAGIEGFAHLVRDKDVDDEFMKLMQNHPYVFFDPNIGLGGRYLYATKPAWFNEPMLHELVPPSQIAFMEKGWQNTAKRVAETGKNRGKESWDMQVRTLTKLRSIKAKIVYGTDSGGDNSRPIGWQTQYEAEGMQLAGFKPTEIIASATRINAQTMLLDHMGAVAPTKSADFLVLNANPLDDIKNLRKIDKVYLRGVPVDRAGLAAQWKAEWEAVKG
jgi:imidazolonepropionase-like amidohydrolase